MCVDQQWTIVENTSQLLTLVQQDIDQLINDTLAQCSTNVLCLHWLLSVSSGAPPTTSEQSPTESDGLPLSTVIIALALATVALAVGWMITCVVVCKKTVKQS